MRYTTSIDINLPLDKVIDLFDNPENTKKWQPSLIEYKPLQGEPGHPGAKTKLRYQMGRREVEMVETVNTRHFPEEFTVTYTAKGVWNLVVNRFEQLDADRTRWTTKHEFQFTGMMKVLSWFMPGVFKKQSRQTMKDFKRFAESQQLVEAE